MSVLPRAPGLPELPGDSSAGHASIQLDARRVAAGSFPFEQPRKRIGRALAASVGSHLALGLLTALILRHAGQVPVDVASATRQSNLSQVVWLPQSGPGGGGGGGGNRMTAPPRQAELPGTDLLTVPVAKPTNLEPLRQTTEPDPVPRLIIPATSLAAARESLPGAIEAPPGPATESQGPGRDHGTGTGRGLGDGEGDGPGQGPGQGGGRGDKVFQVGSGVTNPTLVRQVRPNYTSDAMRARVQGVALVQCVVGTNGAPTDCEIYRTLDPMFGLDQEALKAARQWRFAPGTFHGEPVNVRVVIEMTFALR